jgi:hypothetical protein
MPQFKVTLAEAFQKGQIIERDINGLHVFPFGKDNKGCLLFTVATPEIAVACASTKFMLNRHTLKSEQVKQLRR